MRTPTECGPDLLAKLAAVPPDMLEQLLQLCRGLVSSERSVQGYIALANEIVPGLSPPIHENG